MEGISEVLKNNFSKCLSPSLAEHTYDYFYFCLQYTHYWVPNKSIETRVIDVSQAQSTKDVIDYQFEKSIGNVLKTYY